MSEALKAERRCLVRGQGFGLGFAVATLHSELAFPLGNLKMNKYTFFPGEDTQSPALALEATGDLGTRQGKDAEDPEFIMYSLIQFFLFQSQASLGCLISLGLAFHV